MKPVSKPLYIKRNSDFLFAYRRGKSFVSPYLVTYMVKNRGGQTRVGITASKKIGNAVTRNRSKRIIRAAFAHLPYEIESGYNIIFVARTKTSQVKMDKVLSAMTEHLSCISKENI